MGEAQAAQEYGRMADVFREARPGDQYGPLVELVALHAQHRGAEPADCLDLLARPSTADPRDVAEVLATIAGTDVHAALLVLALEASRQCRERRRTRPSQRIL